MSNKLEYYYNKKPIRIIIALIIIAAIMTGISFGITALIKSLSDKCANEPGKVWNQDLNKCVLQTCPNDGNLCLLKGSPNEANCIPKDYCNGQSNDGHDYIWDSDTCECKLNCSEGEDAWTKDGKHTTPFYNNKPSNELACGIACPENTTTENEGGIGWCPPDNLCGVNKYEDSTNIRTGCFDNKSNTQCRGDNKLICDSDTDCHKSSDGEWYCNVTPCSGKENGKDLVYACQSDSDCNTSGAECLIGNLIKGTQEEDKKLKHFKSVGYCSKNNRHRNDNYCTTKDRIGELSLSSTDSNKKIICPEKEIGVSLNYPQCRNVKNTGCADSLCKNEWQGKTSEDENVIACYSGPENSIPEENVLCCNKNNKAVTPSGKQFCCGISSEEGAHGKRNCTLNTDYGISAKNVYSDNEKYSVEEKIYCSVDENCSSLNDQFYKNLGVDKSLAEDPKNSHYASLYCDTKDNVCKAWCGYFNTPDSSSSNTKYAVLNQVYSSNSENNYSWCASYNDAPKLSNIAYDDQIGYHPLCNKNNEDKYWSSRDAEGMITKGSAVFTDSKTGSVVEPDNMMCLNNFALNNKNYKDVTASDGECKFTADCSNLTIHPSDHKTSKGQVSRIYQWTDPINETWQGNNKWFFNQNNMPKIIQDPDPELIDKNLYYKPESNCEYSRIENVNESPFIKSKNTNRCYYDTKKTIKSYLVKDGTYCPQTGEVPSMVLNGDAWNCAEKENFVNIENNSNINAEYSGHGGKIVDGDKNIYPCGVLGLNRQKTYKISDRQGSTSIFNCENNEQGQGFFTCKNLDGSGFEDCCPNYPPGKLIMPDAHNPTVLKCPEQDHKKCYQNSSKERFPLNPNDHEKGIGNYTCDSTEVSLSNNCNGDDGNYQDISACEDAVKNDKYRCKCDFTNGIAFPDPRKFRSIGSSADQTGTACNFYCKWLNNTLISLLIRSIPQWVHTSNGKNKAEYGGHILAQVTAFGDLGPPYWGTDKNYPPKPNYPAESSGPYESLSEIGYPTPFKSLMSFDQETIGKGSGQIHVSSNYSSNSGPIGVVNWESIYGMEGGTEIKRSLYKKWGGYTVKDNNMSFAFQRFKIPEFTTSDGHKLNISLYAIATTPDSKGVEREQLAIDLSDYSSGGEQYLITQNRPSVWTAHFCFTQTKPDGPIILCVCDKSALKHMTTANLYPSWEAANKHHDWFSGSSPKYNQNIPFLFNTDKLKTLVRPIVQGIGDTGIGLLQPVDQSNIYKYMSNGKYKEYSGTENDDILRANTINTFCTSPINLDSSSDTSCEKY